MNIKNSELNEKERSDLENAFFVKFKKLRQEYELHPDGSHLCGFTIVRDFDKRRNVCTVAATQFGNLENQLNSLLVALQEVLNQYSMQEQIRLLNKLSKSFASRACDLEKQL